MKNKGLILSSLLLMTAFQPSFAKETITFTGYYPIPEMVETMVADFNKENPDIEIIFDKCGFTDCHQKLTVALSVGKDLSQIYTVSSYRIATYINGGGLEDFTKSPYNIKGEDWAFTPSMLQVATDDEGRIYAIPYDAGPAIQAYRKDILEQSGMSYEEVTKSWESFYEFGKKIKAEQGVYLSPSPMELINDAFIWMNGDGEGSVYFDEEGKPNLASDLMVEKVTLLKKMWKDKLFVQLDGSTQSPEFVKLYKTGKLFGSIDGPWLEGRVKDALDPEGVQAGLWQIGKIPGDIEVNIGGTVYIIPSAAENKEAAWKLLQFMQRKENVIKVASFSGSMPARTDIFDDPYFQKESDVFKGQNPWEIYEQVLPLMRPYTTHKADSIAIDELKKAVTRILDRDLDVKKELEKANKSLERKVSILD